MEVEKLSFGGKKTEVEKLSLSNDLIKEACILSMKAHTHNEHYLTKSKKRGVAGSSSSSSSSSIEVLIIAFKGSMEVHTFYDDDRSGETKDDGPFGETNVDCNLFPSLQRIGEKDKPAKVNRSFLQIFQHLLSNSGLKSEVEKAIKDKKEILFTGHSSGGATASLATLWMLDEYTRKQKRLSLDSFGCITFGSPLIGDGTLTHAVRRERWADQFTHFVMEHDIFPRVMLAPKTFMLEHLPDILKFFKQKVKARTTKKSDKFPKIFKKETPERTVDDDQLIDGKKAAAFLKNVLINASTVASHDAYDLMEPTNSLKDKLSADFVRVSPYKPFGVYVFWTRGEDQGAPTPRQQLVVEHPNAVLQLLFYFLQLSNKDQDLAELEVNTCFTEHFSYEEEVNNNGLQLENGVKLEDQWTSEGTTGDAVRTRNKALSELAVSVKWCLLAVEEAENRKKENEKEIKNYMRKYKSTESKKKIIEDMLDEILKYKQHPHQGNIDYYEAFKLQNEYEDFKANVSRLEQAKIWDEIIEMVTRNDLPDEFEVWGELVELGTRFRRLYEPLDIANFYRHDKGDDTGKGYMEVRPKRYKFTQRWYEHANATGFEPGSESNFVADVEELMIAVRKLKKTTKTTEEVTRPEKKVKTIEEVKEELESIEKKVEKWELDAKIEKQDVFWGKSVLSKLEKELVK